MERAQAHGHRDRFDRLLRVCSADHAAFPGRADTICAKAALLRCARAIWVDVTVDAMSHEAAHHARAGAIANALRARPDALREPATSAAG